MNKFVIFLKVCTIFSDCLASYSIKISIFPSLFSPLSSSQIASSPLAQKPSVHAQPAPSFKVELANGA